MSGGRYIQIKQLEELKQEIFRVKHQLDKIPAQTDKLAMFFASHIEPIVNIYQPVISPLASHNGNSIFRARKCIGDKPFSSIRELYNPSIPSGRALSLEETPILYASSSRQTCMSEIDLTVGDFVNIASFDYTNIMNGQFWFVGQLGAFYKSKEQSRYLSKAKVFADAFYAAEHEITHSLVYKDRLFNEIFSTLSSNVDKYVLNRYLIDAIRKKQPKKEDFYGVMFVSVKDAPGTNFAIYGEAIKKLEPKLVNLLRITYIDDYGYVGYEWLGNSKPKDGTLVWR